jgi:lysophospholipase L1-like esterase
MKTTNNLLLAGILVFSCFIGCKRSAEAPYFDVPETEQQYIAAAAQYLLSVHTNVAFTATVSPSGAGWCTTGIRDTPTDYKLLVRLTANTSGNARTAEITVAATGFPEVKISIYQDVVRIADKTTYLSVVKQKLQNSCSENCIVNMVFHGHSVPAGYMEFNQPARPLLAYPNLSLQIVKGRYPYAAVNCITTAIAGENSVTGCARFLTDVMTKNPDVLFIDYALNDMNDNITFENARTSWGTMIQEALKRNVKVILLTPTPNLNVDIQDSQTILGKHAQQIRDLAAYYNVGLVDSYAAFKQIKQNGEELNTYMSTFNHPNEKGHQVVCNLIVEWF